VDVVWVCDRSSASTCVAKDGDKLIGAYCWAHGRRDVLTAARRWPALESWMWAWGEAIGDRSRRPAARLEVWDDPVPLDQHPAAFVARHGELKSHLSHMQTRGEGHRAAKDLHRAKAKVRTSLHNHWEGLTVCVERPEVARENHAAARALRHPVVGRKHSEGAGRVWRAHLAARRVSVLHTVWLWGLNPHHWLRTFFHACADHGGTSPTDRSPFLPWAMTPERRAARARPVPMTLPPFASGFPAQGASASVATSYALIRLVVFSHFSQRAQGLYPGERTRVNGEPRLSDDTASPQVL
jgi:transposase